MQNSRPRATAAAPGRHVGPTASARDASREAAEFLTQVQKAAVGSPYVVRPTRVGFDVALDLLDSQWWPRLERSGVRRTTVHHVQIARGNRRYTVSDVAFELTWVVDDGRRVPAMGRRIRDHGHDVVPLEVAHAMPWGRVRRDLTGLTAEDGRRLVTETAKELGWKQRWGRAEKGALLVGILGVALAVVTAILTVTVN